MSGRHSTKLEATVLSDMTIVVYWDVKQHKNKIVIGHGR